MVISNQQIKKVKKIVKKMLGQSIDSSLSNVEYNKKLWNKYAKEWQSTDIPFEDLKSTKKEAQFLGDEWGNLKAVDQVIKEYIDPYINKQSVVGEIGTGGGRIASKVAGKTKEFYCFDISSEMLRKAKNSLQNFNNVSYELLDSPQFSSNFVSKFDFVYSFDVFVHLDLHTIWKYLQQFKVILKNKGRVFIHTTNLTAPDGWARFVSQEEYHVEGHYFVTPEVINTLIERSGLKKVKESKIDPGNFYYYRDYLVVLENS
jgi:SAM-dependent methyltransferase